MILLVSRVEVGNSATKPRSQNKGIRYDAAGAGVIRSARALDFLEHSLQLPELEHLLPDATLARASS